MKTKNRPKIDPKWGKFLRAPDVYFDKIEGNKLLTPLAKTARVRLGITTGNNNFFYLRQKTIQKWKIEPEFVIPLLKGPRDISSYDVVSRSVPRDFCLVVPKSKTDLKGTNVLKYIKQGEEEGVNLGHFFSNSKSEDWYKITPEYADIVMPYQPNLRHFASIVSKTYVIDKQLVCIISNDETEKQFLAAYLNSTIAMLLKEILSRTSFGLGSIQTSVTDVQNFPVIDPNKVTDQAKEALSEAFGALKVHKIEDIFKEFGCKDPSSFDMSKVRKERKGLDDVVFEVLGFSETERFEVYSAVLQLVSERIAKAKSKGKKSKNYSPKASEIANRVVSDLDEELLVKFPEDFVEGITDTESLSIPGGIGELKINLDGVFLELGHNIIPVDNKIQGEYLRYSAMYGERVIEIPKKEAEQLKVIEKYRPIYERLMKQIDSSLQIYSASEVLQTQIEFEIFKKLRETPE